MDGQLDHQLSYLDWQIEAARASIEAAYAVGNNEPTKEAAFRELDVLLLQRDGLRRRWSTTLGGFREQCESDDYRRMLSGPDAEEIPLCDPEGLIW